MPIAKHSYDADSQSYTVQFKAGGPTYIYNDVDPETAGRITSAEEADVGKAVRANLVQGDFPFNRVDPEPDAEDAS